MAGEKAVAGKEATVKLLSDEYLEEIRPKKKPRTIESYEMQLRLYILPALGKKPVAEVTQADVARVHSSLSKTPVTGNRAVALVSAFMGWCERRGYRTRNTNPCYGLDLPRAVEGEVPQCRRDGRPQGST